MRKDSFVPHESVGEARTVSGIRLPPRLRLFFKAFARKHGRRFPWRHKEVSPYQFLVAEVLLKQTKAESVVPIWKKLIHEFPRPSQLAKANLGKLSNLLRPLGLFRQRAKGLKKLARAITHTGIGVPHTLEELLSLPHVGLYSACALLSFSLGKRVPIVDANVLRVFSRITGENFGIDLRRNKIVWAVAWEILPRREAAQHNYGILDFSALICTAKRPKCTICPLQRDCEYGRQGVMATDD